MSDYGFATYDEKTGRVSEKINSKYPIFGPEYKNISKQYRTLILTDSTVNTVRTASISVPATDVFYDWSDEYNSGVKTGVSEYGSYYDTVVAEYEHGFKKRPFGYATVTGTLRRNDRYTLVQAQQRGSIGGNFSLSGTLTTSATLMPKMNTLAVLGSGDIPLWSYNVVQPKSLAEGGVSGVNIIIPNACSSAFSSWPNQSDVHIGRPGTDPYSSDAGGGGSAGSDFESGKDVIPFWVEITDTKVKVYRRIFWVDHILNVRHIVSGSTIDLANQRTKVIEDYAGSRLEVTIYLVPYNMEDLG
jgi:hypothetical protein